MTTKRGRKDVALLARTANPFTPGPGQTYVANKAILVGELVVPAGVEVPADKLGPRPEAWVRSRRLRIAVPGEDYTSFDDYATMVETAIAEAEALLEQFRPPPEDTSTEE